MRPALKVLALAALLAGGARAGADSGAEVRNVEYSRGPLYGRVLIELDKSATYTVRELPADPEHDRPARIFVDFSPAKRAASLPAQVPGSGILIQRVRVGQYDARTVRVVIDLKDFSSHKVRAMEDPFRVVLDIFGKHGGGIPVAATEPEKPEPKAAEAEAREESTGEDPIAALLGGQYPGEKPAKEPAKKPASAERPGGVEGVLADSSGPGIPMVVVDPGHGGKDPGAIGHKGTLEKDVVLEVSRRLARLLEREGYRVMLTRKDDRFLELSERTEFANRHAGPDDLFVSIHANAAANSRAAGLEVFYWNVQTDRSKAATIARENFTNLETVFQYENSDLKAILSDLKYKEKERVSSVLAGHLQREMVSSARRHHPRLQDLGINHGPLYVLALTNTPSVLVELSFLSNPTEERLLRSESYQQALAEGMFRGIRAFLKERRKEAGL